jgi:hypothetical protein
MTRPNVADLGCRVGIALTGVPDLARIACALLPGRHSGLAPALFRGSTRAHLRPDGKARGKSRRKSANPPLKMAPNGAFSRIQSAISPCPLPAAVDWKWPACKILRLWGHGRTSRPRSFIPAADRHFHRDGIGPRGTGRSTFDGFLDRAASNPAIGEATGV